MKKKTFTRKEVVTIIGELLEMPDLLKDATDNELTNFDANELLSVAESGVQLKNIKTPLSTTDNAYKLKFNEAKETSSLPGCKVMRIPSGWIYTSWNVKLNQFDANTTSPIDVISVFIPYPNKKQ